MAKYVTTMVLWPLSFSPLTIYSSHSQAECIHRWVIPEFGYPKHLAPCLFDCFVLFCFFFVLFCFVLFFVFCFLYFNLAFMNI